MYQHIFHLDRAISRTNETYESNVLHFLHATCAMSATNEHRQLGTLLFHFSVSLKLRLFHDSSPLHCMHF